ncbi:MAG: peptidoglycan glycosyltransferase [Flavobacteriia bacterium]|nr:peptidoglycan glycosyltransferase [Flavobacteriia bacterium]
MQVIDESWALRAQEIAEKRKLITPPRGVMYDRNGIKIVSNKTYYNLMMVEAEIKYLDTNKLAKLLGWTPQQVKNRFYELRKGEGTYYNKHTHKRTSNYQKVRPYAFVKELSPEEIIRIVPHLDDFPGFYEEVTDMRTYPYPNGANILGYCAEVTQEEINKDKFYRPGDNIGRTGVEKVYENELRGKKGVHYIVTSALNNAIEPYAGGKFDTTAKQGPELRLGVDIELQVFGEELMQNKRGSITAIEPQTGEILAMVSAPSYDPNKFIGKRNITENYPKLINDPDKPLYPRPLAAEYPPGSSLKLVQALIGLQEGVITVKSGFPCNKAMVGCHNHPMATDIIKAVQYSCNPYFYYTVRRIIHKGRNKNFYRDAELGLNVWAEYMNSFGLGTKFETDIFGLRAGLIPNSKFYDKWYGHHTWAFSTIRSISIGQGEVKITPLQMANIVAIIANRGWYYTPHFVKKIGEDKAKIEFLKKHKTMVEAIHFDPIIEGMRRVVNEAGGTGSKARMKDIVVCGKTGTVQNSQGEDHSVFIAFAPMDNPKIAISVIVENAGWGGSWAAPIAQLMIEKYLKREIENKLKAQTIKETNLLNVKKKKDKYTIH